MEALILCGGLGTRLRSVVSDRPKALAEVSGRPFLEHQFSWLQASGVQRIILAIGHQSDLIEEYLTSVTPAGLDITCSTEETPLGTGGAIRHALPHMTERTIIVLNGDSLVDVDLKAFIHFHQAHVEDISVVLAHQQDTRRYGRVRCAPDNKIIEFGEKSAHTGPGWINAGIYLIPREVIAAMPAAAFSFEEKILSAPPPPTLYGFAKGGEFIDIGTPEAYAKATAFTDRFWSSEP